MAKAKARSDDCTVVSGRVDIARVSTATGVEGGARSVHSVVSRLARSVASG